MVIVSQFLGLFPQSWKLSSGPKRKLVFIRLSLLFLWLLFMRLGYLLPERTCSLLPGSLPNLIKWTHIFTHVRHIYAYISTCIHAHIPAYILLPPNTCTHPNPQMACICVHTQSIFVSNNVASKYCCDTTALWNSGLSVSPHMPWTLRSCMKAITGEGSGHEESHKNLCFYNPALLLLPKIFAGTVPQLLSAQL